VLNILDDHNVDSLSDECNTLHYSSGDEDSSGNDNTILWWLDEHFKC
jgi:hypothetical protein